MEELSAFINKLVTFWLNNGVIWSKSIFENSQNDFIFFFSSKLAWCLFQVGFAVWKRTRCSAVLLLRWALVAQKRIGVNMKTSGGSLNCYAVWHLVLFPLGSMTVQQKWAVTVMWLSVELHDAPCENGLFLGADVVTSSKMYQIENIKPGISLKLRCLWWWVRRWLAFREEPALLHSWIRKREES